VLEHVPDPIKAINEFARVLKSSGTLLLTAPLGSLLHQEPFHFYGGYTPYWYRKVLAEAGFHEIVVESNGGFFSFFSQEALRFGALLDPRRTWRFGWRSVPLSMLWLMTLPFVRIVFPWTARFLDALRMDQSATVGYHVVAKKKSAAGDRSNSTERRTDPARFGGA
jgi:SAM-dependent methyltransferase